MSGGRIGFDIGALFVKTVFANGTGRLTMDYRPHLGNPVQIISENLINIPQGDHCVGITGSGASILAEQYGLAPINTIEAEIRAVRDKFPDARNILNVGGGSCTIIQLDDEGNFLNFSTNSLCAAGTGSFLDEQKNRLGLTYEMLSDFDFDGVVPTIASRCAVFAKSDLIHRQQEGYSKPALWAGLCKGCVDTFLQTLLKGKPLSGKTVVTGGVVQNPQIMGWLTNYFGDQITTWDHAHLAGALGAMALAPKVVPYNVLINLNSQSHIEGTDSVKRGEALVLDRSDYPCFDVHKEYEDDLKNEVRLWRELEKGNLEVFLGIDIGSTSTKLVLLDTKENVVVDIYRKTGGDPLSAVKSLFQAIENLTDEFEITFTVLGCGTTGSGRKFIGRIIGADQIINEISAHVAGAMKTDPGIDTIFEIGGQDSKYMRTVGGNIRDANMNFICAAGTGSFVEEQANKLGFAVSEIGDLVIGVAPPETSDRCTVFMEEDTNRLLRLGFSRRETIAAVMNSVVKNYLNRVVGNRYISKEKIFFQGATARNKGLVAAFEKQLGVQVVVSPLCHQMGSYGLALLLARDYDQAGASSTFVGFDLHRRAVELSKEECDGCNNNCSITFANIQGSDQRPSWGYMCGKDPEEPARKVNREYGLFRKRGKLLRKRYNNQQVPEDAKTVGLPYTLSTYTYLPLWTAFFNGLGYRLELTPETNEQIKILGTQNSSGDFCFPAKLAIGHALHLAQTADIDFQIFPQVISHKPNDFTTNSLFCPYVQSNGAVVHSIFELRNMDLSTTLMPVLDLRWDEARLLREFDKSLGTPLGRSKRETKKAISTALIAQSEFELGCAEEGLKALESIYRSGEKAILIAGRPYNCFDSGANLGLPEKISEYGYPVIPVDFMPFNATFLGKEFSNIYWNYGQRIIASLRQVADKENLFAVYLSNFNCGPDSFLLTYAEKIMGEKPLLILELDEHGADAGYLTRVEAFLDVVAAAKPAKIGAPIKTVPFGNDDLKKRTVWVPQMHPIAGEYAAGIFEKFGYQAESLPLEDREAHEIGLKAVRGSECLPTCVTIGGLLKKFREIDAKPGEHAFFMATATGPCRFGQYALLHRMILNQYGYEDVPILSPSSYNSYQGLEEKLRRELWWAFLAADVTYKMQCKVRPYEKNPGETNAVAQSQIKNIRKAMAAGTDLQVAMTRAAKAFDAIPRFKEKKPLVGIVGEIYVRCNPYTNGFVIDHIENYGGEAWLAPLSEWFLYTAYLQEWTAKQNIRNITARGKSLLKNHFLFSSEKKMYSWCSPLLDDRHEPPISEVVKSGERFLPINFEGEALITVGRAKHFIDQGASLVVNCAPFGCMPCTLTSSILQQIEQEQGVPIVSMYYDGSAEINRNIEVYIHQSEYAKERGNALASQDSIDQ